MRKTAARFKKEGAHTFMQKMKKKAPFSKTSPLEGSNFMKRS